MRHLASMSLSITILKNFFWFCAAYSNWCKFPLIYNNSSDGDWEKKSSFCPITGLCFHNVYWAEAFWDCCENNNFINHINWQIPCIWWSRASKLIIIKGFFIVLTEMLKMSKNSDTCEVANSFCFLQIHKARWTGMPYTVIPLDFISMGQCKKDVTPVR